MPLPLPPSRLPLIARGLPTPCGVGVSGAYLVSLCAQSGGYRTVGVRDSLSAAGPCGERAVESRPAALSPVPFGRSSPPKREASVSCSMLTTVQARVHRCFPYPFPRRSLQVLLMELEQACACLVCGSTDRLTTASHPRIAPSACAVEDTPFPRWFWWRTRHRERCTLSCSAPVATELKQDVTNPSPKGVVSLSGNE